MKAYTDMTKKELMECLEMASEDAHADAKRQRWAKPVLIEWLLGFAEQTDEPPTVAEEPQTDNADDTQEEVESINGKKISIEIDGKEVERKVTTYARSGRSWIRLLIRPPGRTMNRKLKKINGSPGRARTADLVINSLQPSIDAGL